MIKKFILWFLGLFLTFSTGYYVICKFLIHRTDDFTSLVDNLLSLIVVAFNFIAQHIVVILIVIAVAIILLVAYKFIAKKNNIDKM